jgi:hypothetical protein
MKRFICLILLAVGVPSLLAAEATSTADSTSGYRVTGVVAAAAQGWMVLVETEDGEYLRIRVGDELAGGEVLEIAPRWMRIGFGEREEVWRLTPGEAPAPAKPVVPESSESAPVPGQVSGPLRQLTPATVEALKIEAAQLSGMDVKGGAPERTSQRLFELLNPLLDFKMPAGGSIVQVNGRPPASLAAAIEQIVQGIEQSEPVSLTVRKKEAAPEAAGLERFYLIPDMGDTQ